MFASHNRRSAEVARAPWAGLRLLVDTPLQILVYLRDWAYFYNPPGRGTAFVRSEQLGPGDPASPFVEKDPLPARRTTRPQVESSKTSHCRSLDITG